MRHLPLAASLGVLEGGGSVGCVSTAGRGGCLMLFLSTVTVPFCLALNGLDTDFNCSSRVAPSVRFRSSSLPNLPGVLLGLCAQGSISG